MTIGVKLLGKEEKKKKGEIFSLIDSLSAMENLMGLLRIHVLRGVNLAVRDVSSSDPYAVIKMGKQVTFCFLVFSFLFVCSLIFVFLCSLRHLGLLISDDFFLSFFFPNNWCQATHCFLRWLCFTLELIPSSLCFRGAYEISFDIMVFNKKKLIIEVQTTEHTLSVNNF